MQLDISKREETFLIFIGSISLTSITYLLGYLIGVVQIPINDLLKIEIIGVILNYTCVFLTVRQNIYSWIFGIVAVLFLGILFYQLKLYASLALSIGYFLPIQLFGWWVWYKGRTETTITDDLPTINLSTTGKIIAGCSIPLIWYVLSIVNQYFGATSPFLDMAILVLSVIAQFLITYKWIENWLLWIVVNIISLYVYTSAGAYLLGMQYSIFLINAIIGYNSWRKIK